MEYYVERFEGGVAVCMDTDGKLCRFALEHLPGNVFEGCVLQEENGAFLVDPARTEARKAAMLELQDNLFEEDTQPEDGV